MEKKKIIVPITAGIAALGLLGGATFAYFSATVENKNQTETNLQSNKLGLIFTGLGEIKYTKMIPGDSFKKTFTVENISNRSVDYNIFMQAITNEFNADLVYTLEDSNGVVVAETTLPTTSTEKSYLKQKISIDSKEVKSYILTVTYKYLEDVSQNDYQGKEFKATLGIDTEGMGNTTDTDPVIPPQTTPTKIYTLVSDNDNSNSITVGDEIAVGEEHFYVISNDGDTLNALAKYNLNAGKNCTTWDSCTPIENPTYKQDETMTGAVNNGSWSYGHGSLAFSNTNGWPYSNNDTIDIQSYDGPVKNAINAYKEILPEGIEVRLITKAEIEALVNDGATLLYGSIKDKADAKGVSWVYSTSYWSGSANADRDDFVWSVRSDGYFDGDYFSLDGRDGVRPVIEMAA